MNKQIKNVEDVTISDFKAFPVWEYLNLDDQFGEMAVRPVKEIPVDSLDGRVVGTRVCLSNGLHLWAAICNVDVNNPRRTQHFITISLFHKGDRFHLARYHDFDFNKRGPKALAAFLRLPVAEIFPISYDLSRFSRGNPAVLIGTITEDPKEKLTRTEIIKLALS